MKKILAAAALAVTLLLGSSCRGPQGEPGRDGFSVAQSIIVNVKREHWEYSNIDNNNYFIATVNAPEITKDVLRNGLVKMYRVFEYGSSNETYTELPFILQKEYQIEGSTDWGFYTEATMAEFGVGGVSIIYTVSDFDYELDKTFVPSNMVFRLVILN
ncbi:MAG: hypothetical protein SOZ66_04610 [Candidatus Cryptobacteroides sp.]|nr:hypothetical protein [Candidatus Cryptobacteroides sp.]